jgi:hypothetical protein
VHRVYFGEMAPEGPPGLHYDTGEGIYLCGHCAH